MTMTRSPMTRDKPQQQQGRPQDQQQDQPSLASLRASRKAYSSIGFGMSRQSKRRKNIKCWASAVFHLKLFFFPTFCVCPPAPNGDDLGITPPPLFFFFIPFIILALLSRSLPVVTQIRGHIPGPPPPSPLRYNNAFVFIARRILHFLPSSTRVELCVRTLLRRRSQQLIFFLCCCKNKDRDGGRTQGPTLVVFEGNH